MISKVIKHGRNKLLVIDITDDDVRNECWHRFNLGDTKVEEGTTRDSLVRLPTEFLSNGKIWRELNEDTKND